MQLRYTLDPVKRTLGLSKLAPVCVTCYMSVGHSVSELTHLAGDGLLWPESRLFFRGVPLGGRTVAIVKST